MINISRLSLGSKKTSGRALARRSPYIETNKGKCFGTKPPTPSLLPHATDSVYLPCWRSPRHDSWVPVSLQLWVTRNSKMKCRPVDTRSTLPRCPNQHVGGSFPAQRYLVLWRPAPPHFLFPRPLYLQPVQCLAQLRLASVLTPESYATQLGGAYGEVRLILVVGTLIIFQHQIIFAFD